MRWITQDDDSNDQKRRLKRLESGTKRRFSAINFTVSHRNPSSRITGRFSSYFYTFLGWLITATFWRRFSAVFIVFLPFKAIYDAVFFDLGIISFRFSIALLYFFLFFPALNIWTIFFIEMTWWYKILIYINLSIL
jgi:hypothetical protein